MKKEFLRVLGVLFGLFLTVHIGSHAIASSGRVETILKDTEDLTGDGIKDKVKLTGVKTDTKKYKNLVINVTESNNAHLKINLPTGYNPSLQFIDFNQDGVKDLFASVPTRENGTIAKQKIYTVKNNKSTNLGLPDSLLIESSFLNGYKAKIKIRKTGDSYIFDLRKQKKFYDNSGIYYKGKLNEPTELMVSSFRNLKPVQIGDKIGLEGTQKVMGVSNSDTIGYVESTWLYHQSGWSLVNVVVLKKV